MPAFAEVFCGKLDVADVGGPQPPGRSLPAAASRQRSPAARVPQVRSRVRSARRLRPEIELAFECSKSFLFFHFEFFICGFAGSRRSPQPSPGGGLLLIVAGPSARLRAGLEFGRPVRTVRAAASPREGPLFASASPLVCGSFASCAPIP